MKQNLSNTNLLFACFQNIYQFCEHYLSGIFVAFCLFCCCQENQINPPEGQFLILKNQSEIVWHAFVYILYFSTFTNTHNNGCFQDPDSSMEFHF